MYVGRELAAIANLSGRIFMMGGRNENKTYLSSVEYFDPMTNEWTSVAPMIKRRSAARAGVVRGDLYVVGGWCDGSTNTASIERYDHQTNNWVLVTVVLFCIALLNFTTTSKEYYLMDVISLLFFQINLQLDIQSADFGMITFQISFIITGGKNYSKSKSCNVINLITGEKRKMPSMLCVKNPCHSFQISEPF